MKYVKKYESFKKDKRNKELNPVNEELLGTVINFFKSMWAKATAELKKLGDNPSLKQLDSWLEKNPFNPSDDTYVLKSVMDEFNKKPDANAEACLKLIDDILDPEVGALGKQGMQPFYDQVIKAYGKNLKPLNVIQYYMERIRDRAIKDYKFAGGPDLKVGQPANIDPKKKITGLDDTTHLPDFKKVLKAAVDDKKKKEAAVNWVNKTLVPRLEKYVTEVTEEEVDAYLKTKNISTEGEGDYKAGDLLIYLEKGKKREDWDKLTDEQKKAVGEKPASDIVNVKKVDKVEGDNFSFTAQDNTIFVKTKSDIIGKSEVKEGENEKELQTLLGDMKKDDNQMKQVVDFAKTVKEGDKVKLDAINKIIGGEE